MNSSKHIIEFLDRAAFAELDERSKADARLHIEKCADCRKAFTAARIAELLVKTNSRMNEPVVPPFFQAKVMNAWREKQLARRPIAAFSRWWQASFAPVLMMLLMLGGLISLTIFAPQSKTGDDAAAVEISGYNNDSADAVLLNQNSLGEMTTEQVFQEIYDAQSDAKK